MRRIATVSYSHQTEHVSCGTSRASEQPIFEALSVVLIKGAGCASKSLYGKPVWKIRCLANN
jgi:hypothetical protein